MTPAKCDVSESCKRFPCECCERLDAIKTERDFLLTLLTEMRAAIDAYRDVVVPSVQNEDLFIERQKRLSAVMEHTKCLGKQP